MFEIVSSLPFCVMSASLHVNRCCVLSMHYSLAFLYSLSVFVSRVNYDFVWAPRMSMYMLANYQTIVVMTIKFGSFPCFIVLCILLRILHHLCTLCIASRKFACCVLVFVCCSYDKYYHRFMQVGPRAQS